MFLPVLSAVLIGCAPAGATATDPDAGGPPPDEDASTERVGGGAIEAGAYYPLAVGATWTYRITNTAGVTADKVTTIEALEPANGASGPLAFRTRNEALDQTTINWEQLSAAIVVRYRQDVLDASAAAVLGKTYAPGSDVLDESGAHLVPGAKWTETYVETQIPVAGTSKTTQERVTWTLEALDDVVSVPAGVFTCLRVRRHHATSMNPADEVTWYAPGTGRVKETGSGSAADETKELVGVVMP